MKELFSDPEFLKAFIPTTISLIVTGLASLIIGVYLEKFKGRITVLSRKITSQAIAYSSQDEYWGHIKVLYNDNEAKNLNLFTVEIKNESSRDISDVIVDLKVDDTSMVLASNAYLNESDTTLLLTNEYFQYYLEVMKRNDEESKQIKLGKIKVTEKDPNLAREVTYITTLKKFVIPVLNRGKKATFNILVENFKGIYPAVSADVVQRGIKLNDFEDEGEKNKRLMLYSLGIGLIIFAIAFTAILRAYPSSTTAIIWTGLFGLTYSLIGMIFYFLGRYIKRLLL